MSGRASYPMDRRAAGSRVFGFPFLRTALFLPAGFCLFAMLCSAPALAQDSALAREVQRLQRDLNNLQSYVYNNPRISAGSDSQSGAAAGSGGFDTSDFVTRMRVDMQSMTVQKIE